MDQRLRSGGRWASQNSGEGEPVLFTPPASGDAGPLLTVSDTLWGAQGGSPGTEVSTRAPAGALKSLQVHPRVHRRRGVCRIGLRVTWAVPHSCPSPVKRGQLEPGNTAPGPDWISLERLVIRQQHGVS